MTWIVDASNVIGSRPDGWWRDRAGATRRLVAQLDRFAEGAGEPVIVVLDGGEPPPAERAEVSSPPGAAAMPPTTRSSRCSRPGSRGRAGGDVRRRAGPARAGAG